MFLSNILKNRLKKICIGTFIFLSAIILGLFFFQFEDSVTSEDIRYAHLILTRYNVDTSGVHTNTQTEINFIQLVQQAVQKHAKTGDCIPLHHKRDIKDLYDISCGMCYDKSHVIEKILQIHGFETRHASMYYYKKWYQKFWIAFISKSGSHAVSEAKTKNGWILIDSLSPVLGLKNTDQVLSLREFRELLREKKIDFAVAKLPTYRKKFIFVYGVYSRNGRLYPPYNFIPDYKFNELKYNFTLN